jgi:AraC family transcriptional regulator
MIKTFLLAIFTIVVSLGTYLYFHLGVYEPVNVALEKRGPFELLFKQHTGPYHQISGAIQAVETWVQEHHMQCAQTFGEYLDNPETVDEDRLRSHGGCVLTTAVAVPPPEFQYQKRAERNYAVGRFKGSPAIGPYKVYPKVRRFLNEHNLKSSSPVIELYTVNGNEMTTEYLFAIDAPIVAPAAQ